MAHDAGAARLLFSWLQPLENQLRFYLEGPAIRLFEEMRPGSDLEPDLNACLEKAQVLLR